MPATYAAAHLVLREVRDRVGRVASVLDVGAGAGAASLAASELFPDASITLVEGDRGMQDAARDWLPDARIVSGDVTQMLSLPPHDLVIACYSLYEFAQHIAPKLWEAAQVALAVFEPGTPAGFGTVLAVRDELLRAGAHMVAPCPAATACPMIDPDWCHFAARVERSSLHRRLKEAELGYEDEKFSYIAVGREPVEAAGARVIRRPQHQAGLITLVTCTAAGIRTEAIRKRDRDAFRKARKSEWGGVYL